MAIRIPPNTQKLMAEHGLVPPNCTKVELLLPATGPMLLRYDVWITTEHVEQLAAVFQALAAEMKDREAVG